MALLTTLQVCMKKPFLLTRKLFDLTSIMHGLIRGKEMSSINSDVIRKRSKCMNRLFDLIPTTLVLMKAVVRFSPIGETLMSRCSPTNGPFR